MSDTPEIPAEIASEIPTSVGSDNSSLIDNFEGVENVDSPNTADEIEIPEEETSNGADIEANTTQIERPTNEDVAKISENLKNNATKEVEDEINNLNIPSNEHLRNQMGEAEAPAAEETSAGNKALVAITEANEGMEQALRDFIDSVNQITGEKKPDNANTNNPRSPRIQNPELDINSPKDPVIEAEWLNEMPEGNENESEEAQINEEIIEGEWILIDEGLDPETEEFLRENGEEELTGELNPEELRLYESFRQLILDRFPAVGSVSSAGTLNNMLDSLPNNEGDTLKQVIKILLRTAVRLETRIVAFVADEIAKSADSDDQTTKFIFNAIRDAAKGMESAADTAITGKDKPERLTKAIRNFIFRKKSKS